MSIEQLKQDELLEQTTDVYNHLVEMAIGDRKVTVPDAHDITLAAIHATGRIMAAQIQIAGITKIYEEDQKSYE